ncbi:MAG: oxaloacetate decarboxylase [SAR324 cluster bacterium]|uniref:Oxaloacetate decarboxylase n=1 Tax=SAR324 cluster bacterium TaxID=2024889 RepID=A0A2A4T6B9_9DELT|nr:MAG: oxaloacetate decarboxylase [SAR324 cluster bacterium]
MKLKLVFLLSVAFLLGAFSSLQAEEKISIFAPDDAKVVRVEAQAGSWLYSGDKIVTLKSSDGNKFALRAGQAGKLLSLKVKAFDQVKKGDVLGVLVTSVIIADKPLTEEGSTSGSFGELLTRLYGTTGISALIHGQSMDWTEGVGRLLMMAVALLLLYLGIARKFEPLLLVPIGFGSFLANIPLAGISDPGGILAYIYDAGITTGIFPLIIFMGVGAMTDFGPMIANPKTMLLGGAAQIGIFTTLIGAIALNAVPGIDFSLRDAASIGIIGGADGPTAIFLSSQLSPRLLGSIAVAAYSYMALVPIIQPPIMKWLTTEEERKIKMVQLRHVGKTEKIILPLLVLGLCTFLLPSAAPLIGMFMFGNLIKESGVVERLSDTIQNSLINIVTIFLGLGVGSKLSADKFLNFETFGILILGMIAFCIGTACGVLMAKFMNKVSSTPINPLIGAAGVSAVPMAARVVNKVGLDSDPQNFLLMHAMGANVSGVIGSAVAAGVLLALL